MCGVREAKLITGEIQSGHILCIHCRLDSFFPHITPPRSLKICWLTTLHASCIFSPGLSPLSLDHGPSRTPPPHSLPTTLPHPPSFWRVGSSELVAVCTAKGNVSSTRRKMGQNIRTLTAHAQWHTALGLFVPSESDHCVLSYPLPCSWMFPLLTPVLSHLLLMLHNSSSLHSVVAAIVTERAGPRTPADRTYMLPTCCVCKLMCLISYKSLFWMSKFSDLGFLSLFFCHFWILLTLFWQ